MFLTRKNRHSSGFALFVFVHFSRFRVSPQPPRKMSRLRANIVDNYPTIGRAMQVRFCARTSREFGRLARIWLVRGQFMEYLR